MTQNPPAQHAPQSRQRARFWSLSIVAAVFGFCAAVSIVGALSYAYPYYLRMNSGFWALPPFQLPPLIALPLFLAAVALLVYNVCTAGSVASRPWWRKVDFMVLSLLALHAVLFCVVMVLFYQSVAWLPLLSGVSYLAPLLLLAEGTARLRDKQLRSTCYWLRFFKVYPLGKPMGFLMGLFLFLSFMIPLVTFANILPMSSAITGFSPGDYDQTGLLEYFFSTSLQLIVGSMAFSLFALCALSYFCYYLLTQGDELARKYEKANEAKIRAERFKSELITNVSHDIRTPLTSIVSYVGLLKSLPVDNPEFCDYVEVLDRKSARLSTLTADLLEASKASTGNVPLELSITDLSEMVGQIAGEFDDQFAEKSLTLVFNPPAELAEAQVDTRHLWRILENLFGNTVKYALPGTRVFAELAREGAYWTFSLKNTSEAPIDVQGEELIEQFIRGERARSTEGNGLGLYIAKSLAEVMGVRFAVHTTGDLFEARMRFGI